MNRVGGGVRGCARIGFPTANSTRNLLTKALDREVVLLYILRTVSDHYALNLVVIEVLNREVGACYVGAG